MAEHTEGPWAINPVVATVDSFADGAPLPVCQMLWPTERRSKAETEANARLIAASPVMLEALQELSDHVYISSERLAAHPDASYSVRHSLILKARTAIAVATGEERGDG